MRSPATFRVPVGTPVAALVVAGGATESAVRLVLGGPMMGSLAPDANAPVVKTTSLVLVLPVRHPVVQRRLRDARRQIHLTRAACLSA